MLFLIGLYFGEVEFLFGEKLSRGSGGMLPRESF